MNVAKAIRNLLGSLGAALLVGLLAAPTSLAAFGIVPGSLDGSILGPPPASEAFTQAGGHPDSLSVNFAFNTAEDSEGHLVGDEAGVKEVVTELPAGIVGNPQATPRCDREDFLNGAICPASTQVGIVDVIAQYEGVKDFHFPSPLYNLDPAEGVPAEFGFAPGGAITIARAFVRSDGDYGVSARVENVPQSVSVLKTSFTLWGLPSDPFHDAERGDLGGFGVVCGRDEDGEPIGGPPCPSDAPPVPFLTNPTDCAHGPFETTIRVVSWQGHEDSQSFTSHDAGGNPLGVTGCESVPFSPAISAAPTSKLATNPSGLDFELDLPNTGLLNPDPEAVAETQPKKAVVALPEGVTVNPSQAEGLAVCSEADYGRETATSAPGEGCPNASKIGNLKVKTPLLQEEAEGALYVAEPYNNPSNTLLALYMVAKVPGRGVVVKLAGKVEPDPETGQLVTTFDNLPQLPFESFKLHFREGARAPLVTPPACGTYTTVAEFTPWSAPDEPVSTTSDFTVTGGPDGGPCPTGGLPPFKPGLTAGTINNRAGGFSPFNVRLSRTDAEQEITHFSIKLPPGITGKLAGIPYCPDAAIAAAKARTGPHGGQEELDSPSCPAASEVGRSLGGAGVGSVLAYAPGKVYLAGPYNGSKLSIVAITAGVVGPFDIGTVVIREALQINPETAEVFVDATGSDPIPHIIQGIPVHLRDIRAYVDRPDFVLNPTDCTRTSTASTLLGAGLDFSSAADDNPITVTSPFQAADCAALPFKPKLTMKLVGGTRRGAHPAFRAHLQMNGIGEAGIAYAQVTLPRSEFIENAHFNTICTRVQFKAGAGNGAQCPPGSIYGTAKAVTPILSEPLEGPVFLRSSEHQLPDLVIALHNSQVDFNLIGRVDSVNGQIRNTFESSPDAPVSSFDIALAGGKKGLFVNSTNLCKRKHRAKANFIGQNGKAFNSKPVLKVKCKGKGKGKAGKRQRQQRSR